MIESELLANVMEYGIAAMAIVALVLYIKWSMKQMEKKDEIHLEERREWKADSKIQLGKLLDLHQTSIKVVEQNTNTVASLQRMVENGRSA